MLDPKKLSKIGIGTWGVGGYLELDESINKKKQTEAITYMFERGLNFVDINMLFAQGISVEIVADALKKSSKDRKDIFVCQFIYLNDNKSFHLSKNELKQALELFETEYIDTLQFSMPSFRISNFNEIGKWIDELLESKKIRFTSITNENIKFLKKFYGRYGEKLFSHEVVFNFEVRINETLGVIPYAQKNNIKTVVYQPLRRNRTAMQNWEVLQDLSNKYGKSQNQVIMNWIVSKGYLPLTKSETIKHIDEHIDSLEFEIEQKDLNLLESFIIPNYIEPIIDWDGSGIGVKIGKVSNIFDDLYKKPK